MNADIKSKWVEALRSKKYKQTTGALCNGPAYCCLGVLCTLYITEHASAHFVPGSSSMEFVEDVRNTPYLADFQQDAEDVIPDASYILSEDGELPWTVAKWANLHPTETDTLITLNDMQRFSFNTIADYIEENL